MAGTDIQPEIYAVIAAALLGALIGQFLSFYRQRRQHFEELKSILRLISLLDEEEIPIKIDREESFLWFLREELFQSYKENILYLDSAGTLVLELIRQFPDPGMDEPSGYLDEEELKNDSAEAYRMLDEISPLQVLYLSILGFLGLSQEKHGDRLEEFLEEQDTETTISQLDLDGDSPVTGYVIPQSRLGKITLVWMASILLIIAAAVGIFLAGVYNQVVETAIMVGVVVISVLAFTTTVFVQLIGTKVRSSDFEQEDG